ncbi:hypothetical protein [Crateriforma spongiae]|uniref:hypothetical protein n=1 Tax=Crateriforma spongiae TaxID=2724528 RepID=UPI0039B00824
MSNGLQLPNGWARTKMSALGELVCGTSPPAAEVNKDGNGTPYVTGPEQWDGATLHMDKWTTLPRKVVGAGHIFITVKGAGVGKLFPGKPCAIGRDIYAFKPHEAIDWRFVEHALRFTIQDVITQARGDIPGLSRGHILDHWINVPPALEQERIADRIEELFADLDAGVSALQRVQKKLKRYRAALLHAAVTGRLTADWRAKHGDGGESGSELLARILQARREDWERRTLADYQAKGKVPPKKWRERYPEPPLPVTGELAELPSSWTWATASQLCSTIQNGNTPKAPLMFAGSGEVPFLKVYNLTKDGSLNFAKDPTYISKTTHEEILRRSMCQPGDVLMNIVGPPLGKVSVVPENFPECNINQAIVSYRCLDGFSNQLLCSLLLTESILRPLLDTSKATAGQFNISVGNSRAIAIPVPPRPEQNVLLEKLSEKVSNIDAMETEVDRGLRRAHRLRQAILKAAFEGKLVAQNPDDEPASELLARIQAEADADAANKPKRVPRKRKTVKKKTAKRATT